MKPDDRYALIERCAALEMENARLRSLLDDIHRRKADLPPEPGRYDAMITAESSRPLAHGQHEV